MKHASTMLRSQNMLVYLASPTYLKGSGLDTLEWDYIPFKEMDAYCSVLGKAFEERLESLEYTFKMTGFSSVSG